MKNPTFEKVLKDLSALHEKKNSDYSDLENPYSNFEYAASVAAPFTDPVDRVFAVHLGTKLARLSELSKPGRKPSNESKSDSHNDLANYAAIWAAYRRDNG